MKKYLALLLAVVMVLSLAACGGKTEAPAATEAPKTDDQHRSSTDFNIENTSAYCISAYF